MDMQSSPVLMSQSRTWMSLVRAMWIPSFMGLSPGAVMVMPLRSTSWQSSTDMWICWLLRSRMFSTVRLIHLLSSSAIGALLHLSFLSTRQEVFHHASPLPSMVPSPVTVSPSTLRNMIHHLMFSSGHADRLAGATSLPSSLKVTGDLHLPEKVVCFTRYVFSLGTTRVAG
uniref:Uncharacterized protein n=1 Tax=Triticum urartu TaxID=4572 RepID=A0A8R7P604_TRIUA